MKRIMLVLVAVSFLSGCAAADRSEFFQHDTMYKDGDHLLYSVFKYKKNSPEDARKAREEKWWGETVGSAPREGTPR